MTNKRKKEFKMNNKQQNFAFEVAQEIGVGGKKQRKPGLSAPSTGADALKNDALTKTDYGSFAERPDVPEF